jgi:asparagine synthase (glutamine-hydrolysing)
MLASGAWSPDGKLVRSSRQASLGAGRLITTVQQARPDREPVAQDVFAVVDGRFDELGALRRGLDADPNTSDADLVVAGYRRWGTDVVGRLRGEFALMLWDATASTLVVARDPFGVRPIYYARPGGRLLVASDPEQILATGLVAIDPDDHAVVGHLLWRFADAERSFFRDIRRIPAGHLLVATAAGVRISDHRNLEVSELNLADAREYRAEFKRLFFASVRRRLESTTRSLIHLSGGVDSTAIACVADEICAAEPDLCRGVEAISALYPGMQSNEERYLRAVEAKVQMPVECWDGTAALPDELDAVVVWAPGGRVPWTGGSQGDMEIARREGARVILNGSGGDQLGTPDGAHEDAILQRRWGDAARFMLKAPGADLRSSLRRTLRLAKALSPRWVRDVHDKIRWRRARKPDWMVDRAWREWRPRVTSSAVPPPSLRSHVQRQRWSELTSGRHVFATEWLQQSAMRNGVELRFPFMDWDLIVFALSIPSRYWPPPWPFERLQRTALADMLPDAINRRRGKANATDALANRVSRQLPTIRRLFDSPSWLAGRYVDQASAKRALAVFEASSPPVFWSTWTVWGIATLEAWLRAVWRYTAPPRREA